MTAMIDFTPCIRDYSRTYRGASGKKICVIYEGERYLLKFPPLPPVRHWNMNREESLLNSCFSEHVCCKVLGSIGMNVQRTMLGSYTTDSGVTKTVVACKDFTDDEHTFASFIQLKNSCINSEYSDGTGTELCEILEAFREQIWIDADDLRRFFWDMFIGDTLVGNLDRHNDNWGFLLDRSGKAAIAPIFGCGSCMYPQLEISKYRKILDDRAEIDLRVFTRPLSVIKIDNKRINYFDFVSSLSNEDCNDALLRMYPRIDMPRICKMIEGMPELSDIQKEFYCTMLCERKEKILDRSYEKLTGRSSPESRIQRAADGSERGACLQRESAGGDVEIVPRDGHHVLRDPVGTDPEKKRYALTAGDHVHGLRQGDLLLGIGFACGEHDLAELGRESLAGIREALEAAALGHLHEVLAVSTDAGGPCDPLRDLLGRAGVLGDRESEQRQTHVVGPRQVPCAGYDAPVGLPEVLVVRVVESDRYPAASHLMSSCVPRWRRGPRP